ncbi:MAG: molybdopterin molybdotransferase MoeA [Terriglobales bacterium]
MHALPEGPIVLSFEDARHLVEEHAAELHPRGKELVPLLAAMGLILAEPVAADRDFPPFPRAARDGYALRAADVQDLPSTLDIIGEIKAGAPEDPKMRVGDGQAVSIMTGAAAPQGADAIAMIEHTSQRGSHVDVKKTVIAGENIVPAGSEAKRGNRLLSPGMRLDHAAIAVAASVGRPHLLVYSKPRVAVLATGDEVVDIASLPGPNQIRNSNTYSLAAQIQAVGGEPVLLPIARDEPARLRELISDGLEADLLLISGGVSMGKYDLVEQVMAGFNAEFFFTGAQIQPGRPVVFGRAPSGADVATGPPATQRHKYFFGLPGNPVSTMVTFELFVRPMVEALAGMLPRKLIFLGAKSKSEIKTKIGLKRFLPAILSGEFEHAEVELAGWQGSGDIAATARANCYVVIPPDRELIPAGEWVPVMMR